MAPVSDLETAILDELQQEGPCKMDELLQRLPSYTWNQVFAVLDRLSRQGKLVIQCKRRFEYEVSVPQAFQPLVHGRTHAAPAA